MSLVVNTDPESDNERELDGMRDALKNLQNREADLKEQLAHAEKKINTMKGIITTQQGEIINLKDGLAMAENLMELMRASKEKVVSLLQPKTESKASQADIEIVAKEPATRTKTIKKVKSRCIQAPVMATDFHRTKITQTYSGRKSRGTQYKVEDFTIESSDSEDFDALRVYMGVVAEFYDTDDGF
jgi:uncharacterized coiled-coil protein SlyX